MARTRKKQSQNPDDDTITQGQYTISKPGDSYVVKIGGNVVYADPSYDKIEEYLALVSR